MALERTYTIPLRREWLKVPRYKRAKKAVIAVNRFLRRHMKSDDVRLGKYLNEELWKHGIKNPPSKIRVNVLKDDKGVVRAELVGAPIPKVEEEAKKKGLKEKIVEKIKGKPAEEKKEEAKKPEEETKAEKSAEEKKP